MTSRRAASVASLLIAIGAHAADGDYSFDASDFEKKPFELGGYHELKLDRFDPNPRSVFHALNRGGDFDPFIRATAILNLAGKARLHDWVVTARTHSEFARDSDATARVNRFDELFASWKPSAGIAVDAGKTVLKWGKGYAWNPVGFVERPKDPNDPDLAREGFSVLAADFVWTFEGGPLQTIAFTPLLLPVGSDVNKDFGRPDHVNVAAKLYLLYRDTDIDFYVLGEGSRSRRWGVDFSRNVGTNVEVHGEWAHVSAQDFATVDGGGAVARRTRDVRSWLIGMRYLSARDTTYVAELYRNGAGFGSNEFRSFTALADRALRSGAAPSTLALARSLAPAFGRPNPLRNYLYFRVSQKEPFDILYFAPAVTAIVNLSDKSYSIAPELLYSGRNNVEVRARAIFLAGGAGTDFGEKQNRRRVEVLARFFF